MFGQFFSQLRTGTGSKVEATAPPKNTAHCQPEQAGVYCHAAGNTQQNIRLGGFLK